MSVSVRPGNRQTLNRIARALESARQRGKGRASVPVATLEALLATVAPALQERDELQRAARDAAERIRRVLA